MSFPGVEEKRIFGIFMNLKDDYSIEKMFALHKKRYPYTHDANSNQK